MPNGVLYECCRSALLRRDRDPLWPPDLDRFRLMFAFPFRVLLDGLVIEALVALDELAATDLDGDLAAPLAALFALPFLVSSRAFCPCPVSCF